MVGALVFSYCLGTISSLVTQVKIAAMQNVANGNDANYELLALVQKEMRRTKFSACVPRFVRKRNEHNIRPRTGCRPLHPPTRYLS